LLIHDGKFDRQESDGSVDNDDDEEEAVVVVLPARGVSFCSFGVGLGRELRIVGPSGGGFEVFFVQWS
jgi:hypothetical protein